MRVVDGTLRVGPTDVTRFLACRHLTALDRAAALGGAAPPGPGRLDGVLHRDPGHLRAYLALLRDRGLQVLSTGAADVAGAAPAAAATLAAIEAGADVVHGAVLAGEQGPVGADVLLRRDDRPGRWAWSYDVADAALARRLPVAALLGAAGFGLRLAQVQGIAPQRLVLVTDDLTEQVHPFVECAAFARAAQAGLQAFLAQPPPTAPEPVEHCGRCRWQPACRARWQADDALTLVAGVRRNTADALRRNGIETVAGLAAADPEVVAAAVGAAGPRLQRQAVLQVRARDGDPHPVEVPAAEPGRGLALLPAPSAGDVFFDIEGDPFVGPAGLEYLFGLVDATGYTGYWALTPADERAAFERLVDHLVAACRADPGMHVYHYAPYERDRLEQLCGRHDTRAAQVDELLRGGRFVDLYAVVRQGVRVGVESYSLKALERFTWPAARHGAEVADALGSVVAFERRLVDGDDAALERVRAYNEVDCRSTRALRDWLEGLRAAAGGDTVHPRPAAADPPRAPAALAVPAAATTRLRDRLAAGDAAAQLLAGLLDWHRREALALWPQQPAAAVSAARDRLHALGEWVAAHGADGAGPHWRAARDLLLRRPPRTGAGPTPAGVPLRRPEELAVDAVVRLAAGLDGGVLAVQGPPGAGSAALADRVVADLSRRGLRVGRYGGPGAVDVLPVDVLPVDVLVVTDAERVALADVLAAACAARSLVLLGDPRRADPAVHAVHPSGAGGCALTHLLDGRPTLPPDRGVLLDELGRMHPDVARVVALLSYEGRPVAAPGPRRQRVDGPGPLRGAGVRWVPVPHTGNAAASPQEAQVVAGLVAGLLGGATWTDAAGRSAPLTPADLLVLAPTDPQVRCVRAALDAVPGGADVPVGTVEARRDHEAAVVLCTLAASSAGDARHDPALLPSRRGLTVALSRARALAVVVGSPALRLVPVRTAAQLRDADALCAVVEHAEQHARDEEGMASRGRGT